MIKPFADDQGSSSIGGLTVENGTAAVVISGNVEIARDKAGLERARALMALAEGLVSELEQATDLPDKTAPAQDQAAEIDNPFA